MLGFFGLILFICFVVALVADTYSYPKYSIISLAFAIVCILIVAIMILVSTTNVFFIQ